MCDKCGSDTNLSGETTIIYRNDDTVISSLCPNCLMEAAYNHELPKEKGTYTSELSGKQGALKIVDGAGSESPSTFYLLWEEAERLFRHELAPGEYFDLDKAHHDEFLLHGDFYDPATGAALQPMSEM